MIRRRRYSGGGYRTRTRWVGGSSYSGTGEVNPLVVGLCIAGAVVVGGYVLWMNQVVETTTGTFQASGWYTETKLRAEYCEDVLVETKDRDTGRVISTDWEEDCDWETVASEREFGNFPTNPYFYKDFEVGPFAAIAYGADRLKIEKSQKYVTFFTLDDGRKANHSSANPEQYRYMQSVLPADINRDKASDYPFTLEIKRNGDVATAALVP